LQAHPQFDLWEGGHVDDPCRGATIPVVFSSISIESIEIRVLVFMRISTLSYAWIRWEVHVQLLSKQHGTLHFKSEEVLVIGYTLEQKKYWLICMPQWQ
jgi:hypothetical protein